MSEDLVIVGSGMAGLSAALYGARYDLKTLVIGKELGGLTTKAWIVENYPGVGSIDGYDLMMKVHEQAAQFGAKIVTDKVSKLAKNGREFDLETESGTKYQTKTLVLAVGAARRKLGLPKEGEFSQGKGVHYCTTCDGPLYKNKTIAVVGGGDAAIKGVNLAKQYAKKIYVVVDVDHITADPITYERVKPEIKSGQVELFLGRKVSEILGAQRVNGIKLTDGKTLEIDGLFVEIGAIPEVKLAEHIGVKLDKAGYIEVNNMMETNIAGVYAAGDTTNFFGHFKQDITAAAMGAVAATSAFNHIGRHQ